ncbi:YdcF family protein [Nonomuraea sp. NPDC050404]|uniref:YdcF family protein n=1 Tax=Nonomuraea sp. NPDC050404 TaxID=3155783 RepID=UPI0033D7FBF3
MKIPTDDELATARQLWDYLRLDQQVERAECILVFGGHDLGVARRAVELYRDGLAPRILVSGGPAHVPSGSVFSTEADAIVDVLVRSDVPDAHIYVERLASNTSENFWFSAELLRDLRMSLDCFLIVQKPYCERRTIATAKRRWPEKTVRVASERVTFAQYCDDAIPVSRILSMLAGEILRLESYAKSGLIECGEPVPASLLDAARALQQAGFNGRALAVTTVR